LFLPYKTYYILWTKENAKIIQEKSKENRQQNGIKQKFDTIKMETNDYNKDELVETVKQWVVIDQQMKKLNTQLKQLRTEKKKQNAKMIEMMKSHKIDNFDLKDGNIQYKKQNIREPLTQKKLLNILTEHPSFEPEQAKMLNKFVFENRKRVETDKIVHKSN